MSVSKAKAYKIIDYTARTESGGKYDSLNPDDTGAGISFGLIQYNQGGGRLAGQAGSPLAKLFRLMNAADPKAFSDTFGPYATSMLSEQWVKNSDLNTADFKARLKKSATVQKFKDAQLELARTDYFAPAEEVAKSLGLKSERAHAMLFDTSVQWGPARMRQFARDSSGGALKGLGAVSESDFLKAFAAKADAGKYNRRTKILADPVLSDASVVGLGAGALLAFGGAVWYFKPWRWFL